MGPISFSVFFICLQWLHSCLLAGVFSWLPSPWKIRHRRRHFRGYSIQLAHRRGACGRRSRCWESRCRGIPAGPFWPRFLSRFGCLTLIALVSFVAFLCLSCPGCWNPALNSPVQPCPSGAQAPLVPSPVLVALGNQHVSLRFSRLLSLVSGTFALQALWGYFLFGLGVP